jgi:hypothetical protein
LGEYKTSLAKEDPSQVTVKNDTPEATAPTTQVEVKSEPVSQVESAQNNSDYEITQTKHTKTGADIWVVKPKQRLNPDEFKTLNSKMKSLGGGWSRFTKGFNFKEDPTAKLSEKAAAQTAEVKPKEPEKEVDKTPETGINLEQDKPSQQTKGEISSPTLKIAEFVKDKLSKGKKLTNIDLWKVAAESYGGKQAEGKFTPKDAYDAMELGVNKWLLDQKTLFSQDAKTVIGKLQDMLALLPTQTNRTAEMDEFQQFSTPPSIAYVASWVANMSKDDTVLEPSAGIGGLAVFGKIAGAQVIVNELSQRRAEVLKEMGFDRVFTENAEQLNNILPKDVKPTVVIMNPPFSSTAGRTKGKNDTKNAIVHIEQALKRLEPGGRLVALVGRGMANDAATFRDWWTKLRKEYNVRANIGISGKSWAKYGNTFDTQIVVIDKTGPNQISTVTGKVDKLEDIIPLLEGIRDARNERTDRPKEETKPAASKPTSTKIPAESQTGTGTKPAVSVPTDRVGVDQRQSNNTGRVGTNGSKQPEGSSGLDNVQHGASEVDGPVVETRPSTGSTMAGPERVPAVENPSGSSAVSSGSVEGSTTRSDPSDEGRGAGRLETENTKGKNVEAKQELTDEVYSDYIPQKLKVKGAKPHPADLVQSSAMATVEPPDPTYKPKLPQEVIDEGKLSLAQIEAVVYAGQSHQEVLPDGQRRGFFIGDGTGVGKGREISAIILDNMNQGRKKAVWVSINKDLLRDAQRDFGDLGGNAASLFNHGKIANGTQIKQKDGVIFTTYNTLGTGMSASSSGELSKKKADSKSRLDQLVDWVGTDFDGVIAFDEAHQMQNSLAMKGVRGMSKPGAMALAGVELQKRLPNARVVYVSATGATEVENLAYCDRLGLWGTGTPFADKRGFVSEVKSGGLAAMELVARDMKAMGLYIARNIGFKGVSYTTLEHKLTPAQTEIYDAMAEGWQVVLQNIYEALKATGAMDENTGKTLNGDAKKNALGAFWGAQQRFFNQILTSMQMPSVIKSIKKDIEDGKAVVLQLVNTNEAQMNRALSEQEEGQTLEDLDMTPRGQLMMFVEKSFPIHQFEEYEDDNGNIKSRPVFDSLGDRVINPEAVEMRDALLEKIGAMKVPDGPLEMLLNEFGPDAVAEITGRSRRVVKVLNDDTGRYEKKAETRSKNDAAADEAAFMGDKKQILVFSNAGGTGRSYHADRTKKNQRPRKHYLLQAGWTASTAVQGFGRTHRSNQASAPEYVLATTDLKGQKRFMSSIARRLDQLGALTKGQRQAAGQGLFSEKDNLEGPTASDALAQFYKDLAANHIEGLKPKELMNKMGLIQLLDDRGNLKEDQETRNVPKFLNRLLSLESSLQNKVFDAFADRLETLVEKSIADGTMDAGMENFKADKSVVLEEKTVYTDEKSSAETKLIEFEAYHKIKPFTFAQAQDVAKLSGFIGYYRNTKSGRVYAVRSKGDTTLSNGRVVDSYRLYSQDRENQTITDELKFRQGNWEKIKSDEIEQLWETALDNLPEYRKQKVHLITGALLPIWDRLPTGKVRVVRVLTDDGRILLGRIISPNALDATLRKLGAEGAKQNYAPSELIDRLNDGYEVRLSNDWRIARRRVSMENRFEIIGDNLYTYSGELKAAGVFPERIAYSTRYFIPTGSRAAGILEKVIKYRPVVDILKPSGTRSADAKLKREQASTELEVLSQELSLKLKPAPSALSRADMQAANTLVNIFTGRNLIPFRGRGVQGVADSDVIYINEKTRDPLLYVVKHEIIHTLGTTDPEPLNKLMDLVKKYAINHPAIMKNYRKQDYTEDEIWEEFTSDVISEVMEEPGFWDRVRAKAPELIKRIVDLIDQLIAKFKKAVGNKQSMLKYIRDLEEFKDKVAGVVAENLKSGRRNIELRPDGEIAAKAKGKLGDQTREDSGLNQAISSANTSLSQIASTFRNKWFEPGKLNIDIGGGKYDKGTEYLRDTYGTENLVYDPFNRPEDYNRVIVERLVSGERGDTATANNVLNVIAEPDVRLNVIKQVAKAIKSNGRAYFLIYERDGTGIGKDTSKGWQNNLKTSAYVDEVSQYFKSVERKGNLIIASEPYKIEGPAVWELGNDQRIKFKREPVRKFTLPDEEVQTRMEAARGVPVETMKDKLKEAMADLYRKGHREYEYLPRTGQFSELRNSLLQLRKQKGVAGDKTLKILDDVTKNLNGYEYDVFTYKVIFDDLAHDFDEEMTLPFGLTKDNFEENRTSVDEEAANNVNVMEAVEKRREAWQGVKNSYINAQKAVGFKVEDRLKKEDYYRHQVLEYANAKGMMGSGKKLSTPTGRGFLKQREGSSFDINTDYLQAEYEVMAQMIYDAEVAKVVKVVKDHYDVIDQLKKQATVKNDEGMIEEFKRLLTIMGDPEGDPEKMYRQTLNKKQAIAISKLTALAAKGELPTGPDGKYERIVQKLKARYWESKGKEPDIGEVDLMDEISQGIKDTSGGMGKDFYSYLNWLASEAEEGQAKISARTVFKGMAEKRKAIQNTLGKNYVTWRDMIPEGYSLWQPREGHMFYMANSIPEGIAEQLFHGIAEEVGITSDMLKKDMVVGQKYPELVVPDEVALTLENLYKDAAQDAPIAKLYHTVFRSWKQWQLISPRRYFKYNIRNVTGDLDAVLAGNPGALKKVPQAWKDLKQAFFSKDLVFSPELSEWFKRGGFETLMQAQEINDINRNRQFGHLMESRMKHTPIEWLVSRPKAAWMTYWDSARTSTDFREALLRYATYLDYLEQMQKSGGKPKNFGASNRDEIMGLQDTRDKAAKLTNELLGAYDEVSVVGTWLADNLFPFWRWNEVNFVRYGRLFRNAAQDGNSMAALAGKTTGMVIRSPLIAWNIGKFVLKAVALLGMITAWNMLKYPDEEKELPSDVKSRLHIVLGRDSDGKVIYFSRLGALQDFLDWFGLDTPVQTAQDFLSGKKSIKEIAVTMVEQDANKIINAVTPFIKNTGEALAGIKLYPDAFKPMPIRDRWQYLADSFGLTNEYKSLTGKPSKGYSSSLSDLFIYKSDPYETAYFANKEEIAQWQKKNDKEAGTGGGFTEKGNALYNVKMSMRYGDQKAFEKYLLEYAMLGGTSKGFKQSLESLKPLYGLSKENQKLFIMQLDSEGQENLIKAMDYYGRVLSGGD